MQPKTSGRHPGPGDFPTILCRFGTGPRRRLNIQPVRCVECVIEGCSFLREEGVTLSTILLIILILLLVGALPTWPHSRNWGYAPSGLLGTVLIVIVILLLLGMI